jgi:hypothetical protein
MNGSKPKRAPRSAARARWQQHLTAQQTSSLSQAAYCRAHGLKITSTTKPACDGALSGAGRSRATSSRGGQAESLTDPQDRT